MTLFVSCPDGVWRKEISPRCCMAAVYVCASDRLLATLYACLSTCPSTCLSPQQLPVCFLIYLPVCFFVLRQMFQCCRSLYETVQQRIKKKCLHVDESVRTFTLALCHKFSFDAKPTPLGDRNTYETLVWFHDKHSLVWTSTQALPCWSIPELSFPISRLPDFQHSLFI